MKLRVPIAMAAALTALAGFAVPSVVAAGPPQADTAARSTVIGPAGGSISGFGITARFAAGAVTSPKLIVLGNWPNGLDVPPPHDETAVKTFGLQQCNLNGTDCTSPYGDFLNSPAAGGMQRISGMHLAYTGYQAVTFGGPKNRLVTITINTDGSKVYIYNPNFSDTSRAYPVLLPSTSNGSTLTFKTFRPIVWTLTSPAGAAS